MKKLLAAILLLVLMSSLVYAFIFEEEFILNVIFGYVLLIVFPVIVGIEAVALYNIFDIFKDKDGGWVLLASIVINLISLILNFILVKNPPYYIDVAPIFENYTEVPITVAGIVLFNVFIELVVLKILFNPTLSVGRVLAFMLVNAVTLIILLHGVLLLKWLP